MAEAVRMAFVGCGGMAGAHRKGLETLWSQGCRDFRVVAACDVDESRAAQMAAEVERFQGARPAVYTDIEALLGHREELDAVDIVTVHRAHHTLANACLEAGLDVIVEKPLAITMRAGRSMLDTAARTGRLLAVAEQYRRAPNQRAIRWALERGEIGDPRMLYWIDVGERVWYWHWREHRELAGGGWSLDGGVHFADLFRYHLGPVSRVSAVSRAYYPTRFRSREPLSDPVDVTVEDTTLAILEFANGVTGQWSSTNVAPGRSFQNRAIYGAEGCLDFREGLSTRSGNRGLSELREAYLASLDPEERQRLYPYGITDGVAQELYEFFHAVRGEGKVETDGWEGYRAQAISFAVYESSATGRRIELEQIEALEVEVYQEELNADLGLT
jgi:predicted dehydrogenase